MPKDFVGVVENVEMLNFPTLTGGFADFCKGFLNCLGGADVPRAG
jgi:hypothetical protein